MTKRLDPNFAKRTLLEPGKLNPQLPTLKGEQTTRPNQDPNHIPIEIPWFSASVRFVKKPPLLNYTPFRFISLLPWVTLELATQRSVLSPTAKKAPQVFPAGAFC